MSDNSLTGGKENVRGDEPAGSGIIVAALEIVPASFGIIDIAAITERLICTQCSCQCTRDSYGLTPAIIGIFYYSVLILVNEFYDISLSVAELVIHDERIAVIIVVIDENDVLSRIVALARS